MMKRTLAFFLAMTMLLSLAACGAKEEEPAVSESESAEAEVEAEEVVEEEAWDPLAPYEETVTLTFARNSRHVSNYPEGVTNEDNAYVDLIRDKLNIECETLFEAPDGADYDRQVSLAIASGELPDVMLIIGSNGTGRATLKELADNDLIYDLTEMYEKYGSDEMKAVYGSFAGNKALEAAMVDGKLMALPPSAADVCPMIWIRQDWVDTLGLELDTDGNEIITREELEMVATAFIEKDPGGTGNPVGMALTPNVADMVALTDSFGGYATKYMLNEDGTVSHGSTNPGMKDALAWLNGLYEDGILDSQYGTRTSDDIDQLVFNGQLGILPGVWHMPGWKLNKLYELDSNSHWRAYSLDNGEGKVNYPSSDVVNDKFLVISKECEHPEAVFKIVELLNIKWAYMSSKEQEAYSKELYELEKTGINGYVRPTGIDILGATYFYDSQIKPVMEYLDGTTTSTENFTPINDSVLKGIEGFETDYTKMESVDWGYYTTRMYGIMHHQKLYDAGLYEIGYPIYNYAESMASNPVDLTGLMNETFAKIITGELPLDAFDTYVADRNAQGDAAICEELAATMQ